MHTTEQQLQMTSRSPKVKHDVHIFANQGKMHNNSTLKWDRTEIPGINQYKFLNIIFDKKLTFITHLQYLKKWRKVLKFFHVIAHIENGIDQQTLLKANWTLILFSQLGWGCRIHWLHLSKMVRPPTPPQQVSEICH